MVCTFITLKQDFLLCVHQELLYCGPSQLGLGTFLKNQLIISMWDNF